MTMDLGVSRQATIGLTAAGGLPNARKSVLRIAGYLNTLEIAADVKCG